MSTIELPAQLRTDTGKGPARKLRQSGAVPAVVYQGGNEPTMVTIDPYQLTLAFERSGNPNNLVELQTEGKNFLCLVKEVQRHPVTGDIRHVDFYEVRDNEKIVVEVPVQIVGKAVGVTLGGTLRQIRRDLQVRCLPQDIPSNIEADVTTLDIGKFLKVNEITNPKGVEIMFDDMSIFNVATVIKRRGT